MAGLKYVGADYANDSGDDPNDVVTKLDVDTEFSSATVSQGVVQAQINTAASAYSTQAAVNTALNGFAQSTYLTNQEVGLIPVSAVPPITTMTPTQLAAFQANVATLNGVANQPTLSGGVAPLDTNGKIPSQYIPSLGVGYCQGPYGPTLPMETQTAVATPMKLADWGIGPPQIPFQPMVYMTLLASAILGGRPIVEVRMSSGVATYANQTLVARGIGRSQWNDPNGQVINVVPIPGAAGHSGLSAGGASPGYSSTYNLWLSAWLIDANQQGVTVQSAQIYNAAVYLVRYQT
jgi:hypothetical protein